MEEEVWEEPQAAGGSHGGGGRGRRGSGGGGGGGGSGAEGEGEGMEEVKEGGGGGTRVGREGHDKKSCYIQELYHCLTVAHLALLNGGLRFVEACDGDR